MNSWVLKGQSHEAFLSKDPFAEQYTVPAVKGTEQESLCWSLAREGKIMVKQKLV